MRVQIRVPATSANLGPGFDALGLALDLYNELTVEEADGLDFSVQEGPPAPADEQNLVYKSARYLYDLCGRPMHGLRLRQVNRIPMARGLGSSSACIIGGLVGANELLGRPLPDDELLKLACALEGHPDNVAPALLGGLVAAVMEGGQVYYHKQPLRSDLMFAAFIPDFELRTSAARAVLPREVPRQDAVYNLSRAALLALSLSGGDYQNLRAAVGDRLHQPYRMGLIAGAPEVFGLAQRLGAYAVYLSGAGPTLMALVAADNAGFEPTAREWLAGQLPGWTLQMLRADNFGASFNRV